MAGVFGKPIKGQQDADNMLSYLNNQPDMLTAILKHRTAFKGRTGDLFILPLPKTLDKMTVQLHPPPSLQPKEVDITFDPPMEDLREFRKRVLGWRDEAYRHFKVPQRPRISYYAEPDLLPLTLPIIIAMSALGFAVFGAGVYADRWRKLISDTFGPGMLPGAKWFFVFMHTLEASYMIWAMFAYRVPLPSAVLWVFTTAVLGFPSISEFWESVQYERLRHIYRQTDVGEIPPRVAGADNGSKTAMGNRSPGGIKPNETGNSKSRAGGSKKKAQ